MSEFTDDRKVVFVAIPKKLQGTNVMVAASGWMAENFPWQDYNYITPLGGSERKPQDISRQYDAVCVLPLVNGQIAPESQRDILQLQQLNPDLALYVLNRVTGKAEPTKQVEVMGDKAYEVYKSDGPSSSSAHQGAARV